MTKKERNMLYYQQNRERLKEQARKRRRERRQKALTMVKGEGSSQAETNRHHGEIQTVSIFRAERQESSDIHTETTTEPGSIQNEPLLPTEASSLVNDGSEAESPKSSDLVQKATGQSETDAETPPKSDTCSVNASASPAETLNKVQVSTEQDSAWFQAFFSNAKVTSFEFWPSEFQSGFMSTSERVQQSAGVVTGPSLSEPVNAETSTPLPEEFTLDAERVQSSNESRLDRQIQKPKWYKGWTDLIAAILSSPSTLFRLLLVGGLTWLLTILQFAFYREHDIDPSLAIPLALACEMSLISLVMMSCRSKLENFLRCAAYAVLFGYVIGSLGFDVLHNMRQRAQLGVGGSAISNEAMVGLEVRLTQAQRSLEAATKGRSWDNMAIFGKQVEDLQARIDGLQNKNTLGFSDAHMTQSSMLLIVLLRAVLLIVNSLNVHRLRNELG